MRHTPEEERRRRLQEISRWIREDTAREGGSSLRAIVGKAILRWGPKRETVREYIEDLAWAGLAEVDEKEDRIVWIESSS